VQYWTDSFDLQKQSATDDGHGQRNSIHCFIVILQQDLSHIQYLLGVKLGSVKIIFWQKSKTDPLIFNFFHFSPLTFSFVFLVS